MWITVFNKCDYDGDDEILLNTNSVEKINVTECVACLDDRLKSIGYYVEIGDFYRYGKIFETKAEALKALKGLRLILSQKLKG